MSARTFGNSTTSTMKRTATDVPKTCGPRAGLRNSHFNFNFYFYHSHVALTRQLWERTMRMTSSRGVEAAGSTRRSACPIKLRRITLALLGHARSRVASLPALRRRVRTRRRAPDPKIEIFVVRSRNTSKAFIARGALFDADVVALASTPSVAPLALDIASRLPPARVPHVHRFRAVRPQSCGCWFVQTESLIFHPTRRADDPRRAFSLTTEPTRLHDSAPRRGNRRARDTARIARITASSSARRLLLLAASARCPTGASGARLNSSARSRHDRPSSVRRTPATLHRERRSSHAAYGTAHRCTTMSTSAHPKGTLRSRGARIRRRRAPPPPPPGSEFQSARQISIERPTQMFERHRRLTRATRSFG